MEDRYERVRMVAELLTEVKYETRAKAEEASLNLEVFASVYGPKDPKEIVIRTGVVEYREGDWGVIC
jgi:hypothetical protein